MNIKYGFYAKTEAKMLCKFKNFFFLIREGETDTKKFQNKIRKYTNEKIRELLIFVKFI